MSVISRSRSNTDLIATAGSLSSSSEALSSFVQNQRRLRNNGLVQLPGGDIAKAGSHEIGPLNAGEIRGAGMAHYTRTTLAELDASQGSTWNPNGWRAADILGGTRIIGEGTASEPTLKLLGHSYVTLSHLSIEHAAAKSGGLHQGIGIEYGEAPGGFNCAGNTLDRVVVGNCEIGIRWAVGGDLLQSDHSYRQVWIQDCEVGVEWNGVQQVKHVFENQCYFNRCEIANKINEGGNHEWYGVGANGVGTFYKRYGGGKNVMPDLIHGLRLDNTGNSSIPVVVDMSEATAGGRVSTIGIMAKNTGQAFTVDGNDSNSHYFYKLPANYAAAGAYISRERSGNLFTFSPLDHPTKSRWELANRVGLYDMVNGSPVLVGHLEEDDTKVLL